MENKAHALAAGIFTVVLGAAVLLAAMWFSGDTREKVPFVIESHYPVTGLNEQAAVRYRGVGIGKVTSIEFDPRDPRIILIGISVDRSVTLTRGTYAELRYQGVTGSCWTTPGRFRTRCRPQVSRAPSASSFANPRSRTWPK
jgi:phospholipid/cholesterol/gamma-HCH transport system substrate-binding protein